MANPSWVQDKLLYLTVVSGSDLKRTQSIGKQDPYALVEYGSQRFQTRTCTDGDKNPSFGDNFTIKLITGIPEISIEVWNSKSMSKNCLIGRGKIQLTRVLSKGYDDSSWSLLSDTGRSAGDLKVIMRFEDSEKPSSSSSSSAPPSQPQAWQYCPQFRLPYAACLPFAPFEGYYPQPQPPARPRPPPPPPPQDVYQNVYYQPPPQYFVAPPPQQPPLPPYGYPQGQPYHPCPPPGASYPYGFCPPRGY